MKQVLLTSTALAMALSSGAFAQSTTVPSSHSAATMSSNSPANANAAAMNRADSAKAGMQADSSGMFTSVPSQEDLSSKVVGLNVYNNENTDIGKIKDIAFDSNGVKAYIVAVGGFLGMGDHYVAVRPSAININYDTTNNKWKATMNTDAAQLKAAPEYKYSSNS
jgi:sporulation protein YlmC with PRC-barrel domain